ncbi:hypothetical protein NNC19_08575 [Clostridium sp. SHJSY1]|uniref:hypothetical protein n=1 Tax=Clostridium sp. SHJSY1 TaxID=2942483 RepID=UPI002875BE66|nr:hypothetical protein [Clostridium sp. SHJSY1]MDS0525731.1 hypothetical protein [Clostridium sp. SHJSY1]
MQINTKPSTYNKDIYKNNFFWENKIINNASLWEGYFEDKEITTESKILYIGILDLEKDIIQSSFVVYPSIYSLLGFLQHVFLPTAFFTWFERQINEFYIPMAPFSEIVHEITENNPNLNTQEIASMLEFYSTLDNGWLLDKESLNKFVKSHSEFFNNTWDMDPGQKLFFKVFDNPTKIFEFIKDFIGWSDFNAFIEEEISMSLETFEFTCNNAIKEPLLNKNFIHILNTNLPILI